METFKTYGFTTGYQCVHNTGDFSNWSQEMIIMRNCFQWNSFCGGYDPIHQRETETSKAMKYYGTGCKWDSWHGFRRITKIFHECGLYDLLDHPGDVAENQFCDTFIWGTDQSIDYIAGMQRFMEAHCQQGPGIQWQDWVWASWHVHWFWYEVLFGWQVADPVSQNLCGFCSKMIRFTLIWIFWKCVGLIITSQNEWIASVRRQQQCLRKKSGRDIMPLIKTLWEGCWQQRRGHIQEGANLNGWRN